MTAKLIMNLFISLGTNTFLSKNSIYELFSKNKLMPIAVHSNTNFLIEIKLCLLRTQTEFSNNLHTTQYIKKSASIRHIIWI